ncbi:MAG: polyhydroxyalkanoic acid system family protein [Bacteriovoracia bacterium]
MAFEIKHEKLKEMDAQAIYSTLKSKIEQIEGKSFMEMVQDLKFDDKELTAKAKGTGFEAFIRCLNGKILVDLNLSILLKPMRSAIEKKIEHHVGRALS